MKITYIGHSGFLAELDRILLLFDYYEGQLPPLPAGKRLYVFASHRHPDHFNPEVFQLTEQCPDRFFVLSADIWKSRVPRSCLENTVFLKPDADWTQDGLRVRTLRSTDEGVAFLINTEGHTLYHAGDLNDWRWEGEPERDNLEMSKRFHRYIEPLRDMEIDAAFVPLDPRQEKDYALGLDYFLQLANPKRVYPMHCWEQYDVIGRWLAEHPDSPCRGRIVTISHRNETFIQ
ncbi:MAG: MBL fold metallo-hydrolase [Eubacteriales bacterium]|nr:MBL fold metallo-hydrolase [Eubacteriales bacterium]